MASAYKKDGDKWVHVTEEVGKVTREGKIEGTNYQFKGREVIGGIAITTNEDLIQDGENLVNPVTKTVFKPTRKGTGFWNNTKQIFVKTWGGKK
jgi:hypothetical protein